MKLFGYEIKLNVTKKTTKVTLTVEEAERVAKFLAKDKLENEADKLVKKEVKEATNENA